LFRRPKFTLSCSAEGKQARKEGREQVRKEGRKEASKQGRKEGNLYMKQTSVFQFPYRLISLDLSRYIRKQR
jgi:flagellar biosynthesis/type III secretory pathway protein FliH